MACNVLVTGGAGYIGCHVVKDLLKNNACNVIVFDNLSSGYADLVQQAKLVVGDIRNTDLLYNVLTQEKITAVMHLAAKTSVPESIENPEIYYDNNTMGTLSLLSACKKAQIPHFIFSSTAAVYRRYQDTHSSYQNSQKHIFYLNSQKKRWHPGIKKNN